MMPFHPHSAKHMPKRNVLILQFLYPARAQSSPAAPFLAFWRLRGCGVLSVKGRQFRLTFFTPALSNGGAIVSATRLGSARGTPPNAGRLLEFDDTASSNSPRLVYATT